MNDEQLNKELVNALIKDRRAERRWRNIRFLVRLALIGVLLMLFFSGAKDDVVVHRPYVSLVRLEGEIMAGHPFSVMHVVPALRKAFADKNSQGVLLLINSPGGSATQASIIHDQIVALKKKHHKRVVVVGVDALASGAYLVASPADKIYVNRDTITGSIGVIFSGFGFVDAIDKLGITRRAFTSGNDKDQLDPFRPVQPAAREKMQMVLNQVHQNFIADVKAGRGKRLDLSEQLFSGAFWTGETAVKLGLVDGLGDYWSVMKKEFNTTHARNYTDELPLLDKMVRNIGSTLHLGLTASDPPVKAQAY